MSDLDEAMAEFTSECEEMLERISLSLGKLEKSEADDDTLNSIYRDVHTIKGSSQLFGFQSIGQLGHAMEASLDPLRKGMIEISSLQVDLLYQCIDIISNQLKMLVDTGSEPDIDAELNDYIPKLILLTLKGLGGTPHSFNDFSSLDSEKSDLIDSSEHVSNVEVSDSEKTVTLVESSIDSKKEMPSPKEDVSIPEKEPFLEKEKTTPKKKPIKEAREPTTSTSDAQDTIRVQVGLLDNLMNLTGELVLIRNQVIQLAVNQANREFSNISQRINILTSELQSEVMKTRMQPIGNILNKFHRVVRDLSRNLEKKVELELVGTETELDKTLIEAVKDPITHIVRNAVDHGMESPAERVESGKEETGKIVIRSYHEGGQVVVEISDNGRGIDPAKVTNKALEKGVLSEEEAQKLSERDALFLIFAPGFSTAEKVTNVSGRGVGMDVVKTNIEEIGGVVDLTSEIGRGSVFKLRIPLTLAIVPALIVRSFQRTFAVPQVKLVELIRLEKSDETKKDGIEILQGQPVFRLRGELLPLVSLDEILSGNACEIEESQNIAVLKDGQTIFGLIVDEIEDSAEIVVKPLANFLKFLPIYAGATVLGDGSIALTLDVTGLTSYVTQVSDQNDKSSGVSDSDSEALNEVEFLLISIGAMSDYALPLQHVNRLEEFDPKLFSQSGHQRMVRYRGGLLPVVDICQYFGSSLDENTEKHSVVVVNYGEKIVGFEVDRILDVVSTSTRADTGLTKRTGIDGNLVVGDRVVPVVNTSEVIGDVEHNFFGQLKSTQVQAIEDKIAGSVITPKDCHILCVEDSSFFRKQLKKLLEEFGFRVSFANDGQQGIEFIEEHKKDLSLILTDIEMPVMDGFEMSKMVKENKETSHIPLIAVTTRFRKSDIDRGLALGINKYLEKLNEKDLLANIAEILNLTKMAA